MAKRRLLSGGAAAAMLACLAGVATAADVGAPAPAPEPAPAPVLIQEPPPVPSRPDGAILMPVPPAPSPEEVDRRASELASGLNKPVTGALVEPQVVGGERPPSLEALQSARPGGVVGIPGAPPLEPGREETLRDAGLTYGAKGGLAGRAFAINEMLRRYEDNLDRVYDFDAVVLHHPGSRILMVPPIVSEAQMAFALTEQGQVARETACVYSITRAARLASAPPNWRAYLVRDWGWPKQPADAVLPRTEQEVQYWNKFVAEGWGRGEKQAVDIYLADLGRLQRDIVGMARYRVLLKKGLVENPRVVFNEKSVDGGGGELRGGDRVVRITGQPGLRANGAPWSRGSRDCPR
ncbi:type IV secretory system conjugative DNA transfer family protein [uncultured Rhodoblastus sp.]|uniref:type IV secretory system conjugative DNA transfer family protein n=1 Tax=uncultured Rhodoblastus sp. TaxID=543037 RepID=UPI0025FCE8A3|nr:type IV secretory system conjugative DNA transfer family protein [uncultured Rhodoblastus sp.]